MTDYYCIYQVGYDVIHAVGTSVEQCKQNYLDEIGEEFDGSDSYFQCAVGDCVLLRCTDEVYNRVLKDGGQFECGKIVVWDGCVRTSL